MPMGPPGWDESQPAWGLLNVVFGHIPAPFHRKVSLLDSVRPCRIRGVFRPAADQPAVLGADDLEDVFARGTAFGVTEGR